MNMRFENERFDVAVLNHVERIQRNVEERPEQGRFLFVRRLAEMNGEDAFIPALLVDRERRIERQRPALLEASDHLTAMVGRRVGAVA